MSKIAFDIVILPPDDIQDVCVDLCNKYRDDSGRPALNKIDNLTHISLFMGMVEESDLPKLYNKLKKIITNTQKLKLELAELKQINKTYFFEIKKTPELQELHENIVNNLKDYYPQETTAKMFFGDNIDKSTFFWTDNYVTGSSFKKFWPHITLKACTNPVFENLPLKFTTNTITVCHLGNHCTCRKILWQTKLLNK